MLYCVPRELLPVLLRFTVCAPHRLDCLTHRANAQARRQCMRCDVRDSSVGRALVVQTEIEVRALESGASQDVAGQVSVTFLPVHGHVI